MDSLGPDKCNALNNETLNPKANENISLQKDSKSDFTTLVSDDLHIQTKDYNESDETQHKELHDQTSKMEQVNSNNNNINIPLTNSSITCPQEIAHNTDNVIPQVIEQEKWHDSDQMSGDVKNKLQNKSEKNFESEGKDKSESSKCRIGQGGEQSQIQHLERSKRESQGLFICLLHACINKYHVHALTNIMCVHYRLSCAFISVDSASTAKELKNSKV